MTTLELHYCNITATFPSVRDAPTKTKDPIDLQLKHVGFVTESAMLLTELHQLCALGEDGWVKQTSQYVIVMDGLAQSNLVFP